MACVFDNVAYTSSCVVNKTVMWVVVSVDSHEGNKTVSLVMRTTSRPGVTLDLLSALLTGGGAGDNASAVLVQQVHQRDTLLGQLDHPTGLCGARKRNAQSLELRLLSIQRHAIDILGRSDLREQ